jgi:hypothetical protein
VVQVVQVFGRSPNGEVDGDRLSFELPTNLESIVACDRIDFHLNDSSLHTGIVEGGTTSPCAKEKKGATDRSLANR